MFNINVIIRKYTSSSRGMFTKRIIVDGPRPTGRRQTTVCRQSTANLIEPQTFFSLVTGEKADNQKRNKSR